MSKSETLEANYSRAGYHSQQQWGSNPALVLVDFAQAYYDPESPLFGAEGCQTALDAAKDLLEVARQVRIPVVFTEVRYRKGGTDGGIFYRKAPPLSVFETGNPLGALAGGVTPRENEIVITKQYPSAFFGTSLAATLTSLKIDTVLLTGVTTSGCVRASCVDSMSHGFVTLVVREAVGDRAEGPHEANLFDMSAKYADVISLLEAKNYLIETTA